MVVTRVPLLASLAGMTLLSGCATVQPRQSFPEVERTVSERSNYRVHWNDGGEADKAVASQVDALLAKPLSADVAVQIALLNNRNLQAVYEDLGVAQAELVGAGLLKNPIFDGSVRFVEGGGSPTVDLGIAFDFLDVFFIGLRKNVAEAQLEVAKASVTGAVLDLAGETKIAFYELQAAEQMIGMRRQVEHATASSYDLAKRLREAGNNRSLDVSNERALHEESRLALATSELDAIQKREGLNRLMGLWGARTKWNVSGRLSEPTSDEISGDGLERLAIEKSLDLRASRAAVTVSLRELGIAQPLGYLSELEVGASAERDEGQWELGPSIGLPIPIFSQGQPAVARAQAELRRAEQRYYATAVEIRTTVRASFARTRALRQQVDYYRTVLLPLRQTIVDETQLQYNAMQAAPFQLLQAKRDQIETGRAYLELLKDYWTAKAQLELILSGRTTQLNQTTNSRSEAPSSSSGSSGGH
jgi:cobalt-zinc-cadmium efflux system outer membrane protein